MILIGSSANPELNKLVADKLGVPLANIVLSKFSNGETIVDIGASVRKKDVYVISTGCDPVNDNLMETLMICKACRTSDAGKITLIIHMRVKTEKQNLEDALLHHLWPK